MLSKIVVLTALLAAVYGQAKYPAGISPELCPNYPICDNPYVAAFAQPDPSTRQYNPAPQYAEAPQFQNAPRSNAEIQYNTNLQYNPTPQYNPAAQQYSAAPQYNPAPQQYSAAPQYNPAPQQYSAAPQYNPAPAAAVYPAGVDPFTCPNYPYCKTN